MDAGGVDSTAPAWTSLYRANSSGVHASYSVLVHRLTSLLPRFLQTVPHGPALAARLSFPPSRWTGDFHPFKSFNMSGTRLARCGAGLRRIMARPAGRSPRLPPRAGPPSAVTRACTARVQSGGHRPFGASSARRTAAPCLLRVGAREERNAVAAVPPRQRCATHKPAALLRSGHASA